MKHFIDLFTKNTKYFFKKNVNPVKNDPLAMTTLH